MTRKFQYLSTRVYNNTPGTNIRAYSIESRDQPILTDTSDWLFGVSRFFIQSAQLPVWKPTIDASNNTYLVFSIYDTSTTTNYPVTIQLSSSDNDFYTFQKVVTELNTNIASLWGTIPGTVGNVPVFSFRNNLFTLTTNSAFRGKYKVFFNQPLHQLLNTFEFVEVNATQPSLVQYAEVLLENDTETQYGTTVLEWSPISRIMLQTQGIPVVPESTPELVGDNKSTNRNTQLILEDYKIYVDDSSCTQTISFESQNRVRWHSMNDVPSFNRFSIFCQWIDYQGNAHPILLNFQNKFEVRFGFTQD